jgi:hypothetical protein
MIEVRTSRCALYGGRGVRTTAMRAVTAAERDPGQAA